MKIGITVDAKKFGDEAVVVKDLIGGSIVIFVGSTFVGSTFADSTFASSTFVGSTFAGALNSKDSLGTMMS